MTASDAAAAGIRSGRLAILGAAVAWSLAGIGQRGLQADPATQVAGRAAVAAVALFGVVALFERGRVRRSFLSMGWWGLALAALLAVSSGTFMLGLSHTTVANILFMQAAAPMLAALLGWVLLGERIGGRTWLALALAGVGVVTMAGSSVSSGWLAVTLPLLVTASFAGVIVIARHRREVSMMPATCLSQVLVVLVALPFVNPGSAAADDWPVLVMLGTFQMAVGLALLTVGARLIPPAEVAIISLLEVVLGPLWVWLAYEERPSAATLAGGAIVVAAVVVQATADVGRRREPATTHV